MNPEVLKYIHMLIGDGRISFVNVAINSETLKFSAEFTQRHFLNVEVENSYVGVAPAIRQVVANHPTRGFIKMPNYTVFLNYDTQYASIEALLTSNKYMPNVRIPWDLAVALVTSPEFAVESNQEPDGVVKHYLEFKAEEDSPWVD